MAPRPLPAVIRRIRYRTGPAAKARSVIGLLMIGVILAAVLAGILSAIVAGLSIALHAGG